MSNTPDRTIPAPAPAEPTLGTVSHTAIASALLLGVFLIVVLRSAWVADDAYITLRTIDNWWHGYGLRWNIAERVQTFSHPLWMLLLAAVNGPIREAFWATLVTSVLVAGAGAWLLMRRVAVDAVSAIIALLPLILSRAYVDYSTSGLENPLAHLLLFAFAAVYFRPGEPGRKLLICTTLAALAATNRMDHALIYAPALLVLLARAGLRRGLQNGALGMLPLALWMLFSLFYYGFAFPNTAYAKLVLDSAPAGKLVHQGWAYLLNSLDWDPLTLLCIGAATWLALHTRGQRALALGILLYLCYIVKIGGDFMSGRFLTILLAASVVVLARQPLARARGWAWVVAASLLALGQAASVPTFITHASTQDLGIHNGIADERGHYFGGGGLLNYKPGVGLPANEAVDAGLKLRATAPPGHIEPNGYVGYIAYFAGPGVHFFDYLGLGDPLIARLPPSDPAGFRPGHIMRYVPAGYFQTLRDGVNKIHDPALHAYYDLLRVVTRDPLFSWQRVKAIAVLNWGATAGIPRHFDPFKSYQQTPIPLSLIEKRDNVAWNDWGNFFMDEKGLTIDLEGIRHGGRLSITLDTNDIYELTFLRTGKEIGRARIMPSYAKALYLYQLEVPPPVATQGYDHIRVVPVKGDGKYIMGYLSL